MLDFDEENSWIVNNRTIKSLEAEFGNVKYISEEHYAYKIDNLWGIIKGEGEIVSSPLYNSVGNKKNELIQVTFNGLNAVINNDNQVIWYQIIPNEEEFKYNQSR